MRRRLLTWTKLTVTCWALSACSIPRPEGKVGVVHVLDVPAAYINEFDFKTDFDDNFDIPGGHTGTKRNVKLEDLDRGVWLNAQSYANLRAYTKKLKKRYDDMKRTCGFACIGY